MQDTSTHNSAPQLTCCPATSQKPLLLPSLHKQWNAVLLKDLGRCSMIVPLLTIATAFTSLLRPQSKDFNAEKCQTILFDFVQP